MECAFKLVYTCITIYVIIDPDISINQLKEKINDKIQSNMSINDNYEIVIAGTLNKENGNSINLMSTHKFKTLRADTFYIRPNNILENDILKNDIPENDIP